MHFRIPKALDGGSLFVATRTSIWAVPCKAGAALVPALLAMATPAAAQNVPNTAYFGGATNHIDVSVPVIATVGGRCGFATGGVPNASQNVGALDGANTWTYDFGFTLECTGPSRIAVLSSNGGLKTSPTVAAPGYLDTAPYDVAVHVVRTGGATDGNCQASNLLGSSVAACTLRGTAAPTVGMFVSSPSFGLSGSYVRVTKSAYTGTLVSGSYGDTLTVTISPAS
jgi:hypothetical protein